MYFIDIFTANFYKNQIFYIFSYKKVPFSDVPIFFIRELCLLSRKNNSQKSCCFSELSYEELENYFNNHFYKDIYEPEINKYWICENEIEICNDMLYGALQKLQERKRNIILMYYCLGMKDREVSEILRMKRRNVCKLRQQTLKLLKKQLQEDE